MRPRLACSVPSVEKIQALIEKGAKVNALVDRFTALSRCADEYRTQMWYADAHPQARTWVNGREVMPDDRKKFAERFLDV